MTLRLAPTLFATDEQVEEFILEELRNPGAEDRTDELLDLGRQRNFAWVPGLVDQARDRQQAIAQGRRLRHERDAEAEAAQPVVEAVEGRSQSPQAAKVEPEPEVAAKADPQAAHTASPSAPFTFHKSDLVNTEKPITAEEKQRELENLAKLWSSDPLAYAEKRKELAKRLATPQTTIDQAVRVVRDQQNEDKDPNQATKIIAIGCGESLWHALDGAGYASVRVGDHWENYRIDSVAFEEWLRAEYGRRNQINAGGQWVPQVPGSGALRDAIATLGGIAKFQGEERQPALRIGGDRKVIWLDLGRPDWSAIKITAQGWEVVRRPDVAFVRSRTMLPLPEPVRGGRIKALRDVMNVQAPEFVLAVGWLLQAMNPVGPYPLLDVCGPAEAGKTVACKMLLRTIDPSTAGLRRPSRKVEDLLIAAKNNWTIGFDNLSWMSFEWSDTFCMLATGIASGTRAHYTNDEEHVFTVQRPVLFNGIPGDLSQRSDLASRIIKLQILTVVGAVSVIVEFSCVRARSARRVFVIVELSEQSPRLARSTRGGRVGSHSLRR